MNDLSLIAPNKANVAHLFLRSEDGGYFHYQQCLVTGLRNLLDVDMTHQEVTDTASRFLAHGWRIQP